jgi:hypothetical protein
MSSYNDSDNVRTQLNSGNDDYHENDAAEIDVKEREDIDVEGMHSHSLHNLIQHSKCDRLTTHSVTATMTTSSGHPETESNTSYILPSGDLVDAKNSLRSYSVAAVGWWGCSP